MAGDPKGLTRRSRETPKILSRTYTSRGRSATLPGVKPGILGCFATTKSLPTSTSRMSSPRCPHYRWSVPMPPLFTLTNHRLVGSTKLIPSACPRCGPIMVTMHSMPWKAERPLWKLAHSRKSFPMYLSTNILLRSVSDVVSLDHRLRRADISIRNTNNLLADIGKHHMSSSIARCRI